MIDEGAAVGVIRAHGGGFCHHVAAVLPRQVQGADLVATSHAGFVEAVVGGGGVPPLLRAVYSPLTPRLPRLHSFFFFFFLRASAPGRNHQFSTLG